MRSQSRPRIAVVVTEFAPHTHADVIVSRLIKGYHWKGEQVAPRVEVASLYLDQKPSHDIGVAMANEHGIPIFDTIGEALTLGGQGINVDGVVLVGEHGDYPYNGRGQQLYPRRRFFDTAVAAMVAGGRVVPVYVDKHFSWSFSYAKRMFDTARRLNIPLLAGSSVPLIWRTPPVEWPMGAPMTDAVIVGHGPAEAYEFHALEALQCMVERRAGGETGVRAVHDLPRGELWGDLANGAWSKHLLEVALRTAGIEGEWEYDARGLLRQAFLVEFRDGLRAAVLNFDSFIHTRAFAGQGPQGIVTCRFDGQRRPPWGHFSILVRQIENLILTGRAPYPADRTLLTTGILAAAMRSRAAGGVRLETPELDIAYDAVAHVPDTAVGEVLPFG